MDRQTYPQYMCRTLLLFYFDILFTLGILITLFKTVVLVIPGSQLAVMLFVYLNSFQREFTRNLVVTGFFLDKRVKYARFSGYWCINCC
jgi:hypothetical protein